MTNDTFNFIFIDGLSELYWKIKEENMKNNFDELVNFFHSLRSYLQPHNGSIVAGLHYDLPDFHELSYLTFESNYSFILSPLETGRSSTITGQVILLFLFCII